MGDSWGISFWQWWPTLTNFKMEQHYSCIFKKKATFSFTVGFFWLIFHPGVFIYIALKSFSKDLPAFKTKILVLKLTLCWPYIMYYISFLFFYIIDIIDNFLYNYTVAWYYFIIRYLDEVFSGSFYSLYWDLWNYIFPVHLQLTWIL